MLIALVSARPYAGSWNDGSRLATVECLVDHHTLSIDESIFVRVPATLSPYDPAAPLLQLGTQDKLFIDGHFYSDKSPVPAVILAGVYQCFQWGLGLVAAEQPGSFCFLMNLLSAGLAYVIAVTCIQRLSLVLGLPIREQLLVTGSFALATVAPIYAQHVNNHILLLAVAAGLLIQLVRLQEEHKAARVRSSRFLLVGALAGLGYSLDLGLGPVLLLALAVSLVWRCQSVRLLSFCFLGAVPWLALHHSLNYAVGGTFGPANAVPEYLAWPGSPFGPGNMTGHVGHSGGRLLTYAVELLVGKAGFLGHNLPLFLALAAAPLVWKSLRESHPEISFALLWCLGGWLMYALLSTNLGGVCRSIRWFVPFLAPGYYLLALLIRERPRFACDFALLSAWGLILVAGFWSFGPWNNTIGWLYWPIQGAALVSWSAWRVWWSKREQRPIEAAPRDLASAA
jgi:hypothetical protein